MSIQQLTASFMGAVAVLTTSCNFAYGKDQESFPREFQDRLMGCAYEALENVEIPGAETYVRMSDINDGQVAVVGKHLETDEGMISVETRLENVRAYPSGSIYYSHSVDQDNYNGITVNTTHSSKRNMRWVWQITDYNDQFQINRSGDAREKRFFSKMGSEESVWAVKAGQAMEYYLLECVPWDKFNLTEYNRPLSAASVFPELPKSGESAQAFENQF